MLDGPVEGSGRRPVAAWDGTDDAGDVVADGRYDVEVTAVDADGDEASGSVATGVETRAPGRLVTPQPGDTLAGEVGFEFAPTQEFWPIERVSVQCFGFTEAADADGRFRVSGVQAKRQRFLPLAFERSRVAPRRV